MKAFEGTRGDARQQDTTQDEKRDQTDSIGTQQGERQQEETALGRSKEESDTFATRPALALVDYSKDCLPHRTVAQVAAALVAAASRTTQQAAGRLEDCEVLGVFAALVNAWQG